MISAELNLHLSPGRNENQNIANLAIYTILSFYQSAIQDLYCTLKIAANIFMKCYVLTSTNREFVNTTTRHTETNFTFDKFMAHRGSGRKNQGKIPHILG